MRKPRRRPAANLESPPAPAAPATEARALGGYDGARINHTRGWVYWPTLDTRFELEEYDRLELLKKARALCANMGFPRRIVNGLSNMVGWLSPQADSPDPDWNARAEEAFERVAMNKNIIDARGRENFYDLQTSLVRHRLRDGDMLVALTTSPGGYARLMPYEAHQIGNPSRRGEPRDSDWIDGVKVNRFGRHIAYRILDPQTEKLAQRIDAIDAIYYAELERSGQVRAATALYHAVNNLQDIQEINAATKAGIKAAQQLGLVVENQNDIGAATLREALRGADTTAGMTAERIFSLGGDTAYLQPGQSLKTLHDSRPHPNQMALLDHLARDIAWGVGVSSDLIWNIDALGGANTRYILADAQRWIRAEQDRLADTFCQRVYVYALSKEIAAGRLDKPTTEDWWKCKWIRPEKITVDIGRDGKLQIARKRAGMLSYASYYNELGLDWRRELTQIADERTYLKDLAESRGLTPAEIVPDDASLDLEQREPEPAE
jgi:capsid protein